MSPWVVICSLVGVINATPENFLSAGYGACYHYNSFNYSVHYKHIQVQAVVMTPARWRTMRMQTEEYLMLQYYSDNDKLNYYGGVGYNIGHQLVYSAGLKYNIAKHLSVSAVTYQSYMNHIVIGLNLEL